MDCQSGVCPPECESVFERVHVSWLIRGGTRVLWDLFPTFRDPLPWSFQLQVGDVGNPDGDWQNVGLPVENTFYAIDPEHRSRSKSQWTHYRVQLMTANGTYYSLPTSKEGILSARDWRLAREIVRKERLRARYTAQDGFLLKRRLTGEDCNTCLDLQTMEVTDPFCPECRGTGKKCGYYYPMSCIWAELTPHTRRMHQDPQGVRGTVNDIAISARMLMLPLINEYDVWVSRLTDERYIIRQLQHAAEIKGVPLIANAEFRPVAFSDPIYDIVIPQQDEWLQQVH